MKAEATDPRFSVAGLEAESSTAGTLPGADEAGGAGGTAGALGLDMRTELDVDDAESRTDGNEGTGGEF
jgi:hypothetical protein